MRLSTLLLTVVLTAVPTANCADEEADEPNAEQTRAPVSDEQIAEWIRDLSADDFDIREAATKELENAGPAALPTLRKYLENAGIDERVALTNAITLIREKEFRRFLPRLLRKTEEHVRSLVEEKARTKEDAKNRVDKLCNESLDFEARIRKLKRDLAINPKAGEVIEEETLELRDGIEHRQRDIKKTQESAAKCEAELEQQRLDAQAAVNELNVFTRMARLPQGLAETVDASKLERWSIELMPLDVRLNVAVNAEFVDCPADECLGFLKQIHRMALSWENLDGHVITLDASRGMALGDMLAEVARQANATLTIDREKNTVKITGGHPDESHEQLKE